MLVVTPEQLYAAYSAVPERSGHARQMMAHLIDHTNPTSLSLAMATGIRNPSQVAVTLNRYLNQSGLFVACEKPLSPRPALWFWGIYSLEKETLHG